MKHTVKRIVSMLCAMLVLLSVAASADLRVRAEEGLDLSKMQIVLPVASTKVEQIASAELKRYIFNMTGASLQVVKEGEQTGAAIYLGDTQFAQDKGVAYPTEGDENGEAWAIAAVGQDLVLRGAPTRGTLYAVYHLLEDVLGVRWWNMWEEEVPFGSAVVPEGYTDSGVPALEFREIWPGYVNVSDHAFYARNRINGGLLGISKEYGGNVSYGAPAHTHTFGRYFPEYYESNGWLNYVAESRGDITTNPEWYGMDEAGNRSGARHLCLSSESLQKEFKARLLKSIEYTYNAADAEGRVRPQMFALVPDDHINFCMCQPCQEAIATYKSSGYVLRFINLMAQAVTDAGYTDAVVEMLAYANYIEPPVGVEPLENVQIRFAASGTDLLHGLDHPNNKATLENLQGWAAIAKNNLYNWQYVVNYNNNGVFPNMFYFGEDMTTMVELGVNGWFAEQEHCINVEFWDMKFWLLMKLMEKPVTGEEYTALMDEFIFGYYGDEAGQFIREYLYYMNEKAEQATVHQNFGAHIIGAEWLKAEDILKGQELFDKAFAAAGDDATLLRRLRCARSGLDRVTVENFTRWEDQAEKAGLTLPFTLREVGQRINQTMAEQVVLRGDYYLDEPKIIGRYDVYGTISSILPEELWGIAREHIYEYTADDFRINYGDQVVTDKTSLVGTAIRSDGGSRKASGNNSLILTSGKGIPVYVYDGGGDGLAGKSSYVGTIMESDIQANAGYQLYMMEWRVEQFSKNSYLYIGSDWGTQNPQLPTQLQHLAGETVTVCVSMKVEGVIDGSDPENYPVYYIDRVFVLPQEDQQQHTFEKHPATTAEEVCKVHCTFCGTVETGAHLWNEGEITKMPTKNENGEKVIACTHCGVTKVETVEKGTVVAGDPQISEENTMILLAGTAMLLVASVAFIVIVVIKRKKEEAEV